LPRRCRASSAGPSQRIALETLVPEPFRRLAAPKDLFNGIRHTAAVKINGFPIANVGGGFDVFRLIMKGAELNSIFRG
jgi:hypothetical protein